MTWFRQLAAIVAVLTVVSGPGGPLPARAALAESHGEAGQALSAPVDPPALSAAGAVLWDPEHDVVLHGKDENVARPMASTTKIMTALLALEAGTLDDTVEVSANAASLGEATVGLRAEQRIPMRSLLAGIILRSGNDAAAAIAEHVAESEETFVARMNARAEELGLAATSFVNASGLTDDPRHVASPLDLARLGHVAMADPRFAELAGAPEWADGVLGLLESRNELLRAYPGLTGIKTGYTNLAGFCLVASATRGDRTLYAVVLGSEDSFEDTAALLDYGFDAFRRVQPVATGQEATRARWADAEVAVLLPETLSATVPVHSEVRWRTQVRPQLERPLRSGTEVGSAVLVVDGDLVAEQPLLTADDVGRRPAQSTAGEQVGAAVQESLRTLLWLDPVDRVVGLETPEPH